LPFALFILKNYDLDEPSDGVVYAASLAIGFASFEISVIYPDERAAYFGRALVSH